MRQSVLLGLEERFWCWFFDRTVLVTGYGGNNFTKTKWQYIFERNACVLLKDPD